MLRYLANFSPRSGRPEFTADADVRAVREKYRLRPLFRSIVLDEWLHVRRRDKRFHGAKRANKRPVGGWYDAPVVGREEKRRREIGTTGQKDQEKERKKSRTSDIKERKSGDSTVWENERVRAKEEEKDSLCGGVAAAEGKNV